MPYEIEGYKRPIVGTSRFPRRGQSKGKRRGRTIAIEVVPLRVEERNETEIKTSD